MTPFVELSTKRLCVVKYNTYAVISCVVLTGAYVACQETVHLKTFLIGTRGTLKNKCGGIISKYFEILIKTIRISSLRAKYIRQIFKCDFTYFSKICKFLE